MYSSEYEEEQVSNNSNGNFYQNNKKLVWIFIAIVLFVIVVVILKNKSNSSNNTENNVSVAMYPESSVSIAPGNTYKLIAVVNNNPNATITWMSSDENIAKVDGGVVTAIDYGKATITASYLHSDNQKYETLKEITVADGKNGIAVTEISIKDGNLVMPVGGKYNIGLNVVPTNAYITSKIFKSSDESVVTVDNKGIVEAIGEGEATITINVNNGAFNKELKVFVNKDYTTSEIIVNPTKISLNKESNKIKVGGTVKLSYTVIPSEARNSYLVWTSSDESVMTVDKNGVITALKEGKTTLKLASLNGISDTLDIEVTPDAVLITDINLSLSDVYLEIGQSQTITPVITPETATDKTLTYESSDESVMTVEATNEGTSCSIKAISEGMAILTIKAKTGDVSREFTVTVSSAGIYIDPGIGGGGGSSCKKTCPDGQYVSNCKCVTCESNNYCRGGVKKACPSGYSSKEGASGCTRTSCPAGSYLDSTYSTGCRSCPNGKLCPGGTSMPQACPSGQYCTNNATHSCPSGYRVNGNQTGCSKCSISNCEQYGGNGISCTCTKCNAGYVVSGSSCKLSSSYCSIYKTAYSCATAKCTWNSKTNTCR